MSQNDRPSFDQIKQHNSLVDYLTQRLGAPTKVRRDEHFWPCPEHGGNSFSANDTTYHCFGCGIGGSVIDAAMMLESLSLSDAVEMLARNVPGYVGNDKPLPKRPLRKPEPRKPEPPPKPLSLELVQQNAQNLPAALPFFNHRAITTPTAYKELLGKKTKFPTCYEFLSGEKLWFESPRFAIPNIFGIGTPDMTVRAINYRRDDDWCDEHLFSDVSSRDIVRINEDYRDRLVKQGRSAAWPSLDKLKELVFGPKYRQEAGSNRGAIFNADLIAQRNEEKKIVYRKWPFIILVAEGKEIDTLAIMDAGWPALGVPINTDLYSMLPSILSSINTVYIVGANDPIGRRQALDLYKAVQRGTILTPDKYKDANEVIMAGEADRWFTDQWGIQPILREA